MQRRLATNFAFNIVGLVLPLAVALVTIPLYVAHIGEVRYGILSVIWILLGNLGFLDFGLSRATASALSRLRFAPIRERAAVLGTAIHLNLLLGAFACVALVVVWTPLTSHF